MAVGSIFKVFGMTRLSLSSRPELAYDSELVLALTALLAPQTEGHQDSLHQFYL